jgi:hypothetical protein
MPTVNVACAIACTETQWNRSGRAVTRTLQRLQAEHRGKPELLSENFEFISSRANAGNYVDQNGGAKEAAPRVDAAPTSSRAQTIRLPAAPTLAPVDMAPFGGPSQVIAAETRKTLSARFGV